MHHHRQPGARIIGPSDNPPRFAKPERGEGASELRVEPLEVPFPKMLPLSDREECLMQDAAELPRFCHNSPAFRGMLGHSAQEPDGLAGRQDSSAPTPSNQIRYIEQALVHSLRPGPRKGVVEVESGMVPNEFRGQSLRRRLCWWTSSDRSHQYLILTTVRVLTSDGATGSLSPA